MVSDISPVSCYADAKYVQNEGVWYRSRMNYVREFVM